MLKYFVIIFLLAFGGCDDHQKKKSAKWVGTVGKIVVSPKQNGKYAYHLEYNVSTELEGKDISGTIRVGTSHSKIPPVDNQEVRVQYKKDNPNQYNIIDNIQFITN